FDIVHQFHKYNLKHEAHPHLKEKHVKATKTESVLRYFTKCNNDSVYDSEVLELLKFEKELHKNKVDAIRCLHDNLGTSDVSAKCLLQLKSLYGLNICQRITYNLQVFILCFIIPTFFYGLDVYTDIDLAVEYYE
ncbi:unnamed protein product, partial [Meganyctiphanes norvegica]